MAPEIAIVGAGPAGLVLAGILEENGFDYVVYERSPRSTPPRGGCLDLHRGSGQRALKEAGCHELFKKYARGGYATTAWMWDHKGNRVVSFGEDRDSPEIDRHQLRHVLMSSIPRHKVKWSTGVSSADRSAEGEVVLTLNDGSTESGFKLVVGAEGVWSKVRHLVTTATPKYSDIVFLPLYVHPSNPYHATLESWVGQGAMAILGKGKKIWLQRQGDGHYRCDVGWRGPEGFPKNGEVDLADEADVKRFLLEPDMFANHTPEVRDIIQAGAGPSHPWPLYYMPPDQLNWEPTPGVTLVGDAAHVTTPFVGDGVNCAMRDCVIVVQKLKEHGVTLEAIAEYEKEMFPYAIDVVERSNISGDLLFEVDSPRGWMQKQASDTPLVGITDDC